MKSVLIVAKVSGWHSEVLMENLHFQNQKSPRRPTLIGEHLSDETDVDA